VRRIDPLALVALILFVALAALAVASNGGGAGGGGPTFGRSASIYDESAGGASVLRRYLEQVGRTVVPVQGDRFAPADAGIGTLFLLGPTDPLESADLQALHDFVRQGGTLVIATDLGFTERLLLDDFGLSPRGGAAGAGDVPVRSIAFAVPPVRTLSVDHGLAFQLSDAATPLVFDDGAPFVALASEGRGQVFAVGSLAPFVNAGIGLADNGRFALALAQGAARVGFDEYHHGVRPAPEFTALLVQTWLGRALLAYRGTERSALPGYVRAASEIGSSTQGTSQSGTSENGAIARPVLDADQVWSILELARITPGSARARRRQRRSR